MAGMTQKEYVQKALILLEEAQDCLSKALAETPEGHSRTFPYPETRRLLASVRHSGYQLHCDWNYVWRKANQK